MSRPVKTVAKLSAAALALGLLAGCATTQQEGYDPNAVATAQERAEAALAAAQEAQATAEAANTTANEAKEIAQEAQGLAKAAQFAADRNSEKLDRMFKKSMYK